MLDVKYQPPDTRCGCQSVQTASHSVRHSLLSPLKSALREGTCGLLRTKEDSICEQLIRGCFQARHMQFSDTRIVCLTVAKRTRVRLLLPAAPSWSLTEVG